MPLGGRCRAVPGNMATRAPPLKEGALSAWQSLPLGVIRTLQGITSSLVGPGWPPECLMTRACSVLEPSSLYSLTVLIMCTHRRSAGLYLHSCRALLCGIRYSGHHSLVGQVQKLRSYIQGSCSWGQMGEAKREEAEDLSLVVLASPFSLWAE